MELNPIKPRPYIWSAALILGTIVVGAAIRFAHLGLPVGVVKYGGSLLWAATIYWVASTVLARTRILTIALAAGAVATAVEFFKLYRSPGMDAFRGTLPGVLLLGRYFSPWDVLAYWVAIAAAAALDRSTRPRALS